MGASLFNSRVLTWLTSENRYRNVFMSLLFSNQNWITKTDRMVFLVKYDSRKYTSGNIDMHLSHSNSQTKFAFIVPVAKFAFIVIRAHTVSGLRTTSEASLLISGVLSQEQVSRTGTSNYIPQILWDVNHLFYQYFFIHIRFNECDYRANN